MFIFNTALYVVPADYSEPAPYLEYSVLFTSPNGTMFKYQCVRGYRFKVGVSSMTVERKIAAHHVGFEGFRCLGKLEMT